MQHRKHKVQWQGSYNVHGCADSTKLSDLPMGASSACRLEREAPGETLGHRWVWPIQSFGVVQFVLGDWNCPFHSKSKMALHLFCKCLLPINNAAETRTKPLASRNRAWVSGRVHSERRVPGTPAQKPGRAQRPNRARPGAVLAHAHAHARERKLPRSRCSAEAGRRAGAQESGAPGGAGARELSSSIRSPGRPKAPPSPRPSPSPARGLRAPHAARVRARAQARALRGRPRRPKESVDP